MCGCERRIGGVGQRLVAEGRIGQRYRIEKNNLLKIFAAFMVVARLGSAGTACSELGVCCGGAATCRRNAALFARKAEARIPVNTLFINASCNILTWLIQGRDTVNLETTPSRPSNVRIADNTTGAGKDVGIGPMNAIEVCSSREGLARIAARPESRDFSAAFQLHGAVGRATMIHHASPCEFRRRGCAACSDGTQRRGLWSRQEVQS